ncbi:hypothetical protein L6452_12979 [Arctium lappa]|uniref:Uncharacterized protein n=1 Tax=Arctium lappa TaxID=4217 RepID=A0ACB9CGZ5_ARCLA|nr:hypothetical protein L6452_12979 [Arctium lappa]
MYSYSFASIKAFFTTFGADCAILDNNGKQLKQAKGSPIRPKNEALDGLLELIGPDWPVEPNWFNLNGPRPIL